MANEKRPWTEELGASIIRDAFLVTGPQQTIEERQVNTETGEERVSKRIETQSEWDARRANNAISIIKAMDPNSPDMKELREFYESSTFVAVVCGVALDPVTQRFFVVTEAEKSKYDPVQGLRTHWRADSSPRARALANKAYSLIGWRVLVHRYEGERNGNKTSDLIDLTPIREDSNANPAELQAKFQNCFDAAMKKAEANRRNR